jgi:rsbT antagonist protein RsbS
VNPVQVAFAFRRGNINPLAPILASIKNRFSQTMTTNTEVPGVAIQLSRNIVVASIQVDLDDDVLARFRGDLLQRVQASGSRGVILDVSGLNTLDADEFAAVRQIMVMTAIMGAESVLVGLQPGVVSALIETGADIDGIRAAINLDAAFDLLLSVPELEPDSATESAVATDGPLDPEPSSEQDADGEGIR